MKITNKNIIFILLIMIIITFLFNYDVYIIEKDKEICKPIYITKRDMFSNIENPNNNVYEKAIEKFKNEDELENIYENFDISNNSILSSTELKESIIPIIDNNYKKLVISNVIDVLNKLPIKLTKNIKDLLEYFSHIYQNSTSIQEFYKKITSDPNMTKKPFNSKYSNIIIYLIDQFDYYNNQ